MVQSSTARRADWAAANGPMVVAAGRHRDLPVCPRWVGPEHNEKSFAEWWEMDFEEEVVRSMRDPTSENVHDMMKHYLSLIDPNVKAAIETSVLARRTEEPIRRAEAERQVAARRAHMQAAARGRSEVVARDGDEGGDSITCAPPLHVLPQASQGMHR
eukprot:jgi/Tetstr1/465976/TSEL_010567.t1